MAHPLMGGYGKDPILTSFSIKENLFGLCRNWSNSRLSRHGMRNALLEATGLEWTFAPNLVLESVVETPRGTKVLMSDRKGRVLAECKPSQKTLEKGRKMNFSSPWVTTGLWSLKKKTGKFSYLLDIISRNSLPLKALRPLTRLCHQFVKLSFRDFNGLYSSVMAVCRQNFEIGRNLECRSNYTTHGRPTLCGDKRFPVRKPGIPQWYWSERNSLDSRCKTWKAA